MALSVANATAIVQATTFDYWNIDSKPERRKIAEKYFVPQVNAYPPVGALAVGYDAVSFAPVLFYPVFCATNHVSHSWMRPGTASTRKAGKRGSSRRKEKCG